MGVEWGLEVRVGGLAGSWLAGPALSELVQTSVYHYNKGSRKSLFSQGHVMFYMKPSYLHLSKAV